MKQRPGILTGLPPVAGREGKEILKWVQDQLMDLIRTDNDRTSLELRPITAEPERPREGMVVYADGTEWDPGSGKGVYVWDGAAWSFLG